MSDLSSDQPGERSSKRNIVKSSGRHSAKSSNQLIVNSPSTLFHMYSAPNITIPSIAALHISLLSDRKPITRRHTIIANGIYASGVEGHLRHRVELEYTHATASLSGALDSLVNKWRPPPHQRSSLHQPQCSSTVGLTNLYHTAPTPSSQSITEPPPQSDSPPGTSPTTARTSPSPS